MKKNGLIQKFRKFWDSLSYYERVDLWDILTCLRGEDEGKSSIKHRTTARIRAELFGMENENHRAIFCKSLRDAVIKDGVWNISYIRDTWKKNASGHFKNHVNLAIQALNKHVPKSRIRDLQKFLKIQGRRK